ncbi:MAG: type II toxin-antitoxin system Phd/YefM family antitoxin [Bacteroidetes bacterium]|nr:MAG: type II toxin-antitoxin system Phd/YefM family antitoxin [Bacteroidota bacterium]
MCIVIKTQVIKQSRKPIAVIMDYDEYKRLKEIEEDNEDYNSAIKVKISNKKWTSHKTLKKQLGID